MVFTFGTPFAYGVFREPISVTFRFSTVEISTLFSLMLFTFFIGSGIVGIVTNRVAPRKLLLATAGAAALIAPSLYVVDSYLGLALVFAVLGLALGTAFVVIASVVPRWFDERTGVAIGLIFVGNGIGMTALPVAWQLAFDRLGVAYGFFVIMSVTAAAFALAGLVCRRPAWATRTADTMVSWRWVTHVARTRTFQLLFFGMGLAFAWYQLVAAYAIDLFTARGLSATGASIAYGLIGGVSILSRIGSGFAADRVGSRWAFLVSLGCSAVGVLLLLVPHVSALTGAIVLMGIGLGGAATLYIPLLMMVYPPENDMAIVGLANIAAGIAALATPMLGTAAVAYLDGYTGAILLTAAILLGGIWLIQAGMERASAHGS